MNSRLRPILIALAFLLGCGVQIGTDKGGGSGCGGSDSGDTAED